MEVVPLYVERLHLCLADLEAFNATLSPAPVFPCASPLLLIQSQTNMHWFAVGLVK